MITAASASTSSAQTIELASPPPKIPHAGSPKWPKISAQPSKALRMIPIRLMPSTQPGRSSAETKLRIAWNSRNGSIDHM